MQFSNKHKLNSRAINNFVHLFLQKAGIIKTNFWTNHLSLSYHPISAPTTTMSLEALNSPPLVGLTVGCCYGLLPLAKHAATTVTTAALPFSTVKCLNVASYVLALFSTMRPGYVQLCQRLVFHSVAFYCWYVLISL